MTAEGAHARALEEHIRALLHEHADRVVPGDALPDIRARIARRPWWRRALAHLTASKTAARGATRAAAKPNDCEESKDMHTLQSETTPRGRQIAAALALAHLLESGPDETAEWRIGADGALHGHVRRPHSDADARRAVHEFAGFLGNKGAERSQGRNDHSEWIRICTSGTYRDVPVNVWTHVDIRAVSPDASFGGTSVPSVYEDMGVRNAIRAEIARGQDGGTR